MKVAFLFPGQGAQSVGMGKDFYDNYPQAKKIIDKADQLLGFSLSQIMFEGPEDQLVQTKYSQLALFVISAAILAVVEDLYPNLTPSVCAGLSLGEYTALYASKRLSFEETLGLIQIRSILMDKSCKQSNGSMAAVLGLSEEEVAQVCNGLGNLWIANVNAPGQIVISGEKESVDKAQDLLRDKGAKRVVPLQVAGAFHSGLMQDAEKALHSYLEEFIFTPSSIDMVMNVTGDYVSEDQIKQILQKQITHSVRWADGIFRMMDKGIELYLEIGSGNTLSGLNRKIGAKPTLSLGKAEAIHQLSQHIEVEHAESITK